MHVDCSVLSGILASRATTGENETASKAVAVSIAIFILFPSSLFVLDCTFIEPGISGSVGLQSITVQ